MKTADLLDLVKANRSFTSDYQLAKALKVPPQTVSQWRSGVSFPSLPRIYHLCSGAGLEPGLVIAQLELERAEQAGRTEEAFVWRQWLEKVGGLAASVLLGAVLIAPTPAESRSASGTCERAGGGGLYLTSTGRRISRRRLAAWIDPLLGVFRPLNLGAA